MVQALGNAEPHGQTALLDLPPELGRAREFDRTQLGYMVKAIKSLYPTYTSEELNTCQYNYPQFAESIAGAREMSDIINNKIIGFDDLVKHMASE